MPKSDSPLPFFLAGKWLTSDDSVAIFSPWDSSRAGTIAIASPADLETAISKAVSVQDELSGTPRYRRAKWCADIARHISKTGEELAQLITRESGKPLQYARAEVARAVTTFTLASEEATRLSGEQVPLDIAAATQDAWGFTLRVPRGPVAAIAPFNYPLNLVAHKIAPAIASGCAVILKPAPQTPLTALKLAEIIAEVGMPEGSVSIMPMANETAEAMVRDDRVAVLSFTGSAPVGWHLKSISGRKSVLLELGGNAPAIVLDDADTEYAATKLSIAGFAAAGQVCIKAQRLLIHEAIYEDFIQKFLLKVKSIKSGNPHESDTIVGPVIDSKSADRIQAWVDEAITQGAKSLLEFHRDGNVISPVILTDTTQQMKVECDEVFGPVVVIKKIRGLDAAIDIANDSAFGLQAGVFTSNVNSIRETAQRLKFGGVIFNDSPMLRVDNFPYGGSRQSGLGREGVKYSMQEFTESRMIVVRFPGS